MTIRVEFFGIPRQRSGVETVDIEASSLKDVLMRLSEQFPDFASACLEGRHLRATYIANINGQTFTHDPETTLNPGDTVMILSADAGG